MRKPSSTGSEALIVRPVTRMTSWATFCTTTPATYPQATRIPEATACQAHERAMSEGDTLTAYIASAAMTPRNDKPMRTLCQEAGALSEQERGLSPRGTLAPAASNKRAHGNGCDCNGMPVMAGDVFLPPG